MSCSSASIRDSLIVLEGVIMDSDGRVVNDVFLTLLGQKIDVNEGRFCFESIYPETDIVFDIEALGKKKSISMERASYYILIIFEDVSSAKDPKVQFERLPESVSYDVYCTKGADPGN